MNGLYVTIHIVDLVNIDSINIKRQYILFFLFIGPNNWSTNNVWIDADKRVHLKLSHSPTTGWTCAELYTNVKFGFGTFRWFVEGAIDKFDRNVVLGLFTYGGVDGINEIDIEVAKWGRTEPEALNLFYTVYPRTLDAKQVSNGTLMSLQGTYTTHQFTWTSEHVAFQGQHGFMNSSDQNIFSSYQTPPSFSRVMPYLDAPLHMNLWAFQGKPPTDGREVEIILHDFKYTKA
jgi:hypothetical protein